MSPGCKLDLRPALPLMVRSEDAPAYSASSQRSPGKATGGAAGGDPVSQAEGERVVLRLPDWAWSEIVEGLALARERAVNWNQPARAQNIEDLIRCLEQLGERTMGDQVVAGYRFSAVLKKGPATLELRLSE